MSKKADANYRMIDAKTLASKAQEYSRETGVVSDGDFTEMYIDGANAIIDLLIVMPPSQITVPSFSDERLTEIAKIHEHDAGYLQGEENIKMFVAGAKMVLAEIGKMDMTDLELEIRYMQIDLEEKYE